MFQGVEIMGIPKLRLRTIELWSDERIESFAIKLSGETGFRAFTNSKTKYVNVVDASPYFGEDYEYSWDYTLKMWIGKEEGIANQAFAAIQEQKHHIVE